MSDEAFVVDKTSSAPGVENSEPAPSRLDQSEPKTGKGPSILDQLRQVIEAEVKRPSIEIAIPDRQGVSVVLSPNITQDELTSWRRKAGERSKDGMNFLKFSAEVIAQTTEAIKFNNEEVTDEDGYPLTFASQAILDMVDEERPGMQALKRFWGSDAHLQASALKVIEEAGWGDEAEVANPTNE